MPRWIFEPGHTAAGFRTRHMMVSWVRGQFSDVHGWLEFDVDKPTELALEATIQANRLWTGEHDRDEHLRAPDFLDVKKHGTITFESTKSSCVGAADFDVSGNLTIRGISRPVLLHMHYLGKWGTPFWTEAGDMGPVTRVGFAGETRINRNDFDVSWNGQMENNGVVVSDEVLITVDVEAMLETELKKAQAGAA
ncbi:MAG: YceI family protein [Pirellulaceae bacterium]